MKPVLICPKCGRNEGEVRFIEAFCIDCYPVSVKVPDRVELERCKRCGRMLLRGEWTLYDEKKVEAFILGKCRGEFSSASYDFGKQMAVFVMHRGGKEMRPERLVPFALNTVMCPQCNRISGGYYQGIIQLRGDPKKVERLARTLIGRLEKKTFISKTEEKDGGLDIYVGSSKAVVGAVGGLGMRVLITKKLIGRDEGKRLYRTTFAIRL